MDLFLVVQCGVLDSWLFVGFEQLAEFRLLTFAPEAREGRARAYFVALVVLSVCFHLVCLLCLRFVSLVLASGQHGGVWPLACAPEASGGSAQACLLLFR